MLVLFASLFTIAWQAIQQFISNNNYFQTENDDRFVLLDIDYCDDCSDDSDSDESFDESDSEEKEIDEEED